MNVSGAFKPNEAPNKWIEDQGTTSDDVIKQNNRGSRKRRDKKPYLYNASSFTDPKKEKARRKAVIARKHRVQEKNRLVEVISERDNLKKELADMIYERDHLNQQLADVTDERDRLKPLYDINAELDSIKQQLARVISERDNFKQQLEHLKNVTWV